MMKKLFIILSVIFLIGNLQDLHAEKIPVPEFYGVYVVADGKLLELKPSDVSFGSGQVGLKEISKVEVMDNKAYIIVYKKGVEPTRWGLAKLRFVSSDVVGVAPLPGWKEEKKAVSLNAWVLERAIELKVAPIENKQDMYRLVPNSPLAPGVYALPSGLFGKLSLTDPFGAQLEAADRAQIFGSKAFVFTISGGLSSQAGVPSSTPTSGTQDKITIASLTQNISDTNHFVARSKVFDTSFDIVWAGVSRYLAKQGEITTSDISKGILITEQSSSDFKSKIVALIEKDSEHSNKVTVKGFCYEYSTYQIGRRMTSGWKRGSAAFCSDIALKGIGKEIEKELEKQKKQIPPASQETTKGSEE